MKEGYIIREQGKAHFVTATVVDWIDVFSRKSYRDCVIECLDYCIKNKGMILYGYVIMSNHIHMLYASLKTNNSQKDVLLKQKCKMDLFKHYAEELNQGVLTKEDIQEAQDFLEKGFEGTDGEFPILIPKVMANFWKTTKTPNTTRTLPDMIRRLLRPRFDEVENYQKLNKYVVEKNKDTERILRFLIEDKQLISTQT